MPGQFIAAIMSAHLPDPEAWQDWLRHELVQHKVELGNDGNMTADGNYMGFYRLLSREQAQHEFGRALWFSLDEVPPWLGHPVGFFAWCHLGCESEAESHLLPALVELSRGLCVRIDDGRFVHLATEREFSLSNLIGKHGFDDGDAFLSRNPDSEYLRATVLQTRRVLEEAGLDVFIGIYGTHHNPLRMTGDVTKDGKVVDDRVLWDLNIRLWTLNWPVLREETFWLE